ncbi:MAG: ECF transporter S component [Candidatus Methanofastidiosia archaeon]
MKAKDVALVALFVSISVVLRFSPLKYPTPWGMKIDLVAVPILVAYFLFGFRTAFLCLTLVGLTIVVSSPDSWIGASAKFLATLPMFLFLEILVVLRGNREILRDPRYATLGLMIGVLFRGILMIPLNYYVFLPIWLTKTTEEIMKFLPWWGIFIPNVIQGAIDVVLSYLLVFKTKAFRLVVED